MLFATSSVSAQVAAPPVKRFLRVVPESTPKGYGPNLLEKRVHEKLGGWVRVEVHSRAQKFDKLVELSEDERRAWCDVLQPVREQFACSISEELVSAVVQANGAESSKLATMLPAGKRE